MSDRYATANQHMICSPTKPHGKPCCFSKKCLKKCTWGLRNSDTSYPDIHINILPCSNNSFHSSFARPSLLPCKLSPKILLNQVTDDWYFPGRSFGNYYFSLCFSFFSIQILGPGYHTSKQQTELWSYWEIMMQSSLNDMLCSFFLSFCVPP